VTSPFSASRRLQRWISLSHFQGFWARSGRYEHRALLRSDAFHDQASRARLRFEDQRDGALRPYLGEYERVPAENALPRVSTQRSHRGAHVVAIHEQAAQVRVARGVADEMRHRNGERGLLRDEHSDGEQRPVCAVAVWTVRSLDDEHDRSDAGIEMPERGHDEVWR
jgi:hypothetical protein